MYQACRRLTTRHLPPFYFCMSHHDEASGFDTTISNSFLGQILVEDACDILADISDRQRTLKSKHAKRDKLR